MRNTPSATSQIVPDQQARPLSPADDLAARGLTKGADGMVRPAWAKTAELERYYDTEWGRPAHTESQIFAALCLESLVAGLSWLTILRRREALYSAFAGFDPDTVSKFTEDDVHRLMQDPTVIRNRRKIEAVIANARACVALRTEGGLHHLVWSYHDPTHVPQDPADLPKYTPQAAELAQKLKAFGFQMIGAVTAYELLQATGVINNRVGN